MLRSFSQTALLARGINKDLTVWLDGARLPHKYVFKNNMSSMSSKIDLLRPYYVSIRDTLTLLMKWHLVNCHLAD